MSQHLNIIENYTNTHSVQELTPGRFVGLQIPPNGAIQCIDGNIHG